MWGSAMSVIEFPKPELTVIVEPEFDFDAMFESLKGYDYERVLVIAISPESGFEWFGNLTDAEANFFMDQAKAKLLED